MTQGSEDRANDALEALLSEARRHPPRPDAALLTRITADGIAEQARLRDTAAEQARPASQPGWSLRRLLAGAWPASVALAGCLVLGVGLGARFEADLTTLGAAYLGEAAQEESVLWSYELALEEGV